MPYRPSSTGISSLTSSIRKFGFFAGRLTGCVLFIVLATKVSDVFALRYALLIVGAVQLLSIPVARSILQGWGVSSIGPENWNRAKTTGKSAVSVAINCYYEHVITECIMPVMRPVSVRTGANRPDFGPVAPGRLGV